MKRNLHRANRQSWIHVCTHKHTQPRIATRYQNVKEQRYSQPCAHAASHRTPLIPTMHFHDTWTSPRCQVPIRSFTKRSQNPPTSARGKHHTTIQRHDHLPCNTRNKHLIMRAKNTRPTPTRLGKSASYSYNPYFRNYFSILEPPALLGNLAKPRRKVVF